MNKDRIGLYKLSNILKHLNFSREFSLIKSDESSWYCGSFCILGRNQADCIYTSFADIKYMVRLRLIYKTGKHRYSFRLKETKDYFEKLNNYDKKLMLHHYGPNSKFKFNPYVKQGGKTRPIISNYRYKLKKLMDRKARLSQTEYEEDIVDKFIPPKVKIKRKPWAYNRQKTKKELEKDFLS